MCNYILNYYNNYRGKLFCSRQVIKFFPTYYRVTSPCMHTSICLGKQSEDTNVVPGRIDLLFKFFLSIGNGKQWKLNIHEHQLYF